MKPTSINAPSPITFLAFMVSAAALGGGCAVEPASAEEQAQSDTADSKLPSGFFVSKETGYYASGAGHYCAFTSCEQWLGAGGPRSGAPRFDPIPNSMIYDGICESSSSNAGSGGSNSGGGAMCSSVGTVGSLRPMDMTTGLATGRRQ